MFRDFKTIGLILLVWGIATRGEASGFRVPLVLGGIPFQVEVARHPDALRRGLMHRLHLGKREGMLFVYPRERHVSLWMKNTPIPLDMLFITRHKRIAFIHHGAVPYTETPMISPVPVLYALEIKGGEARKLGLKPGSPVKFSLTMEKQP